MSDYVPDHIVSQIEECKENGKYEDAMKIVNSILIKNPMNESALLQVADIHYRQGEMQKAEKAIDFLNTTSKHNDPMPLYIKGVLEMEKNNWEEARLFFQKACELTEANNHEILRCYGLSEYRYGNRERGVKLLKDAFALFDNDPELICNLVQVYILEKRYTSAEKMIKYYYKNVDRLEIIDKSLEHYQHNIAMFHEFLKISADTHNKKNK